MQLIPGEGGAAVEGCNAGAGKGRRRQQGLVRWEKRQGSGLARLSAWKRKCKDWFREEEV